VPTQPRHQDATAELPEWGQRRVVCVHVIRKTVEKDYGNATLRPACHVGDLERAGPDDLVRPSHRDILGHRRRASGHMVALSAYWYTPLRRLRSHGTDRIFRRPRTAPRGRLFFP